MKMYLGRKLIPLMILWLLSHLVFDGFTIDGPVEINSVIGKAHTAGKATPKGMPALKGRGSWPRARS